MLDSYIKIEIMRSAQTTIDGSKSELVGFKIEDNGIGFNTDNYNSFKTLDSEYKIEKGCKGIGRLLWLKAFQRVSVKSIYKEGTSLMLRKFLFNTQKDIYNETNENDIKLDISTIVSLENIKSEYLNSIPKTVSTISKLLLEHCIWYFIREGSAPNITIIDTDESISLNREYDEYMLNAAQPQTFTIKGVDFDITHVKLKINSANQNTVSYCAANRLVLNESLKNEIPGLFGTLKDGTEEFNYMCFVSSDYLTEKVAPERLSFNIPDKVSGELFNEISFNDIRDKVIENVKAYLESFLIENREIGKAKVLNYINEKAPRYRSILKRISDDDQIVNPDISDKNLELRLYSHLSKIETELISEGHDLMIPQQMEDVEEYSKRIDDYLSKATDLKQSDLANYVTHRKVILDLLAKALNKTPEGKYVKEEVIHKLIMPMQKGSNDLFEKDANLWIIDERLSFHNYMASDKTIKSMDCTDSDSTKEPDLFSLNIFENPLLVNDGESLPLASITIVEIKRPMRDDAKSGEEKNPIEQALGYLKRVRNGSVQTENGRLIPNSEQIPGFCYILCDITPSITECCQKFDLTITSDKMGYFGYHKYYNAYIEVISFDRLLNSAKQRNRAFFDKLGLPTN